MEDLKVLRTETDKIDDEIVALYKKRMDIVAKIAKAKADTGYALNDSTREKEIINRITKDCDDDMKISLKQLYDTIFSQSKSYQCKINKISSATTEKILECKASGSKRFPVSATVACQGVRGAYSGIATEKLFEISDVTYLSNFEGVFNAVDKGLCEYGVLPIENSNAGSVSEVYDLMKKYNFYIVKSVRLQISHVIAAKKGATLKGIKTVYSHAQALAQCSDYLKNAGVETVICANTAMAGKAVADSDRLDVAAICSEECANIYGLEILEKGVQDNANNFTRFICISKQMQIFDGADKISVMTSLSNKPGSLNKMLSRFSAQSLNLTKLESRPISNCAFEFMFYFDFEGAIDGDGVLELIAELDNSSDKVVFLGSYREITA